MQFYYGDLYYFFKLEFVVFYLLMKVYLIRFFLSLMATFLIPFFFRFLF